MQVVTLTTDFGEADWFVGTMKGVILGIAPKARLVDLTHDVAPGDIRGGAFALAAAAPFFPKGTIHLVVVDPGVGGERAGIAVETENGRFVGPDNGVLTWALRDERIKEVRLLQNPDFRLPQTSHTFHGRDIFAPAAAHLARGAALSKFGPKASGLVELEWPEPRYHEGAWIGEVVYVDRFGNALTNLTESLVHMSGAERVRVGKRVLPVRRYYQSVRSGEPLALISSCDLLEIAVNGGSAAKTLRLRVGSKVTLPSATGDKLLD